ncbi:MAG: sensor histidine kinase [Saccharofermentanales bacterium]
MKVSLRTRLSIAFISVALILIIMISVFLNFFLKNQFKNYTIGRLEDRISTAIQSVKAEYNNDKGTWDTEGIQNIGLAALGEGLIVRLTDQSDISIWDAMEHNNGMCLAVMESVASNMTTYNRNFNGTFEEKSFDVESGGDIVGHLYIGYYGPYFYSESDIIYLLSLNRFLMIAAAVSFILCILLGGIIARNLTRPISGVVKAAGAIAAGDYDSRITGTTGTLELDELTESINSLADTLQSQNALRKRLTADVAHELRTPLATLQSHTEAMLDGIWKPELSRIRSCHEEIVRMSGLVSELEALTRLEAQSGPLDYSEVDLGDLLMGVKNNLENDFIRKNISLVLTGDSVKLHADKDKLKQVFINLLSNALRYTPEGGKTEIAMAASNDEVRIDITDTGIGIPEEDLPLIFERFYRTDQSRSRDTGGFGIGLTIAKSIVEAHGGRIEVRSTPGTGSTFSVILPLR